MSDKIEIGDKVRVTPNAGAPFIGEVLDVLWSWDGPKYIDLGYVVRHPNGGENTYQLHEHYLTIVEKAPPEEEL